MRIPVLLAAVVIVTAAGSSSYAQSRYGELANLFVDWRQYQKPPMVDEVPFYSPDSMSQELEGAAEYRRRLSEIDTTGWAIPQRVDYHIVWAEMNGFEFDHRVLRPWERDPGFWVMLYWSQSDVPEREAPQVEGTIELWIYQFPLLDHDAAEIREGLRRIPPLYEHARTVLTGNARDLWIAGIGSIDAQIGDLDRLAEAVEGSHDEMIPEIDAARAATVRFRDWLTEQASEKDGPSGIGIENYEWYMHNVHLIPFTWDEQMAIIRRELHRAHASLREEEYRNRRLPEQTPIASAEEYEEAFHQAVTDYLAFLASAEIMTIEGYMDDALRAQIGGYVPADRERGFFTIVDYHDPIVMRTHHHHWIELARMANEAHQSPIRRVPLLYNIFDSRAEGLATWMEEAMMHAGLLDDRPRSRELIWILLAQRGARALAEMYMHSNQMTMQEAAEFASKWVPRGWLPADGSTIQHELHFYLQQPWYGVSYVVGKAQLDALLAKKMLQAGHDYSFRHFMDDLNGSGIIPVSLLEWEMLE